MILDDIVAYKKQQLEKEKETIKSYENAIENLEIRNLGEALNKDNISVIAEIKKASPSKGVIREDFNPARIAAVYEEIKVDAISVLTEKHYFMGDDSYPGIVKKASTRPVLRKDFIIDEYQIFQSKAIGADALLLIERILGGRLKSFYKLTREIGLDALVEVHDERGLNNALEADCRIIGINNRDLSNFTVDLKTTERLIKHIPEGITRVSESGIKGPQDIRYLRSLGVNAVLIGETFMRALDTPSLLATSLHQIRRDG